MTDTAEMWLLDELRRAAAEYDEMPEWAKPIKTDPDALIAGGSL